MRAGTVLETIASSSSGALRLSELSGALGLPMSSLSNICRALEASRLLKREPGGAYVLGSRLVELARAYLGSSLPIASFHEIVSSMPVLGAVTAQLAVLDGQDVLYMARRDGSQPFQISSGVGVRLPATCTAVGKVLLANLPVTLEELGIRPPFRTATDRSHRGVESLRQDLEGVRARGYAVDDEETSLGVMCFAVYVPEPLGLGTGEHGFAVGATVLKAAHRQELERDIVEDLRKLSTLLTAGPAPGA